jgi:glycosyltransferase involved in cell wall biosynthesis
LYGAEMKKCQVAYSGFNPKDFPKSDWQNKLDSLKSRPINIISVGRSHWKKGYVFALDAMAKLKLEGLEFIYTIIGAKGNEELTFLRNQLDLEEEVTFISNIPFLEVKSKIRNADILLLPSVEEGIANVVLESMFLGTLVVSTDCGGMIETVEDAKSGFIVPVRAPKAIAEAVKTIKYRDEKVLTAMLNAAYAKVSVQHSTAESIASMKELYKSVLK